ncbi:hypothetical protein WA538_004752, partial [Blastocystis sp. DL]
MNEHSILLDANPSVLKSLSLNSTDSVPKALRATNTGTALGILNQISEASSQCESLFKLLSDRFFTLNKRIDKAQKSVERIKEQVEAEESYLLSHSVDDLISEEAESCVEKSYEPFDFFSLPDKERKKRTFKTPIPDLRSVQRLFKDPNVPIEEELCSLIASPPPSLTPTTRKSPQAPEQSISLTSSLAREFSETVRLAPSLSSSLIDRSREPPPPPLSLPPAD